MTDHSALMRAAVEHDISHVRLGEAVAFIEANMEPEKAEEAISLIHAAISPGHAVQRQRPAMAEPVSEEPAAEQEADREGDDPLTDDDKSRARAPKKVTRRKAKAPK